MWADCDNGNPGRQHRYREAATRRAGFSEYYRSISSHDPCTNQRHSFAQASQALFYAPITAETNTPQDSHDSVTLRLADEPVETSISRIAPDKSPVHGTVGAGGKKGHYAAELLNTNRQSPERTALLSSTGKPTVKMSSAEALPSDTQEISQSIIDKIIQQNKETGNNGFDSNAFDRNTLMSLQEGDSGHIDLLSGFDAAQIRAPNTDENENENDDQSSSRIGDSSPLVYERDHFPESQRFVTKTPVTATKQHDVGTISTGSPLVSRNPLASDLESASGIMALSQVFKATQAPSSPLVNGLQSDFMSDRPSPNVPIQHRPLAPSLTSPFNTIAATFPRESSDTPLKYVTMKESQTNRNDLLKDRMTRSADHIYEDQSDGEFDKEPSFVERQSRQRRINEEAGVQFAMLSAPARQFSPIENQAGSIAGSLTGAPRRGSADGSTETILEEPHGPTSELQTVGTSEEETEQEEELRNPTPRSQPPNSSNEEDKENCNDPSTAGLSNTGSAHDRLSQALSLHESPLAPHKGSAKSSLDTQPHPQNDGLNDGPVDAIRSSPIYVVKDSQRSPGRDYVEQPEDELVDSPSNRSQSRSHGSQLQNRSTPSHEQCHSIPAREVNHRVSIQGSQQGNNQFETAHVVSFSPTRPDIAAGLIRSSNPSREGSMGPQTNFVRFKNSSAPSSIDNGDKATVHGSRGKSSSMPSRIAETPVHQQQRSSHDLQQFATIPETSPNHVNNEGWMSDGNNDPGDQEDDDLPPPLPRTFDRANQSQPLVSDSSSPIKPLFNSKILSSPSGRQRRALTEIAADASPQVGGSAFDVNINIMSADDHEFRSAVAMSPIPPRKKRRSNDGRNIPASDPIIPVTPRSKVRLTPPQEVEEVAVAPPPQPTELVGQRQRTFPGRPKSSRRSDSFWDMEDSPKFKVSSKERSRIFARSLARERPPPPAPVSETKEGSQPIPAPVPAPVSASVPAPAPNSEEITPTPVPGPPSSAPIVEEALADEDQQPALDTILVAPNQVLAPWRGQKRAYYPAACFGKPFGTPQDQYLVKFEDSAPVEVPLGTVKRLELRIGDAVKVDMPNVPKVTHIIRGFTDKLSADELQSNETATGFIPVTDVHGHLTVVLGPKQRKSLPSGGLSGPENVINVPISRIYLDTILWNQLKDRPYTYNSVSVSAENRPQTPSDRHLTPTSPSTRLSRSFRLSNGLFSGMVFAVSYGDKSETKHRVTKMILENDGRILEDGFNELFELPLNAPLTTPTKSPAPQATGANGGLRLRPGAEEVGFACLIADKHSRRPKYMQALALSLPCLSDRWIEDCVAKGQVLDWEMYLLPSGESSYLNGATKSRILTPYPATKARFSETVAARPNLLNGQSVLLITGRSGKADEERRKAYIFLTYALGASKIERVPDIRSARAILDQQNSGEESSSWDWVYIDDDDKAAKALTAGNGGPASLPSKKRRKSRLTEPVNGDDLSLNNGVRVVGNEFVCQSLILGRLVDQ